MVPCNAALKGRSSTFVQSIGTRSGVRLKFCRQPADLTTAGIPWACFLAAVGGTLDRESYRQPGARHSVRENPNLELGHQFGTGAAREFVETRRHPRFKLEIDIRIYPRNRAVVRGHTVDISESGISALLVTEVPIGEVVRLEFALPLGEIEVHALVRQRNAFRYGFQFLESPCAQEIIARTCRHLAIEQGSQNPQTP